MLIKRVYEIDPLECPRCRGQITVVAFIDPPQGDVIERILKHCGLWQPSTPRPPLAREGWVHDPDGDSDEPTKRHTMSRGQLSVRGHGHVLGRPTDSRRRLPVRGRCALRRGSRSPFSEIFPRRKWSFPAAL